MGPLQEITEEITCSHVPKYAFEICAPKTHRQSPAQCWWQPLPVCCVLLLCLPDVTGMGPPFLSFLLPLQIIGTLEEVHMPQNGINHPGVTALAQAFSINPLLRVINLNDNTFTEKGAVAMAEVRWACWGRLG